MDSCCLTFKSIKPARPRPTLVGPTSPTPLHEHYALFMLVISVHTLIKVPLTNIICRLDIESGVLIRISMVYYVHTAHTNTSVTSFGGVCQDETNGCHWTY